MSVFVFLCYFVLSFTRKVYLWNLLDFWLTCWIFQVHGSVGEPWWLWVEDPINDHIYHSEYYLLQKKQVCPQLPHYHLELQQPNVLEGPYHTSGVCVCVHACACVCVFVCECVHAHFSLQVVTGEPQTIVFTIPIFEPLPSQYYIKAVSDRWLGAEAICIINFQNLILPQRHPPHTGIRIHTSLTHSHNNFYIN